MNNLTDAGSAGELITVRQLPVIEESLSRIKAEMEEKAEKALSMVCTEETLTAVRAVRADLRRDFANFEMKRIAVKSAVLEPYERFEAVYRSCVTEPHRLVDAALKGKIESVECELRDQKRLVIKAYFNELCAASGITFLAFEDTGINVTRSASEKSLRRTAREFVDRVKGDMAVIGGMDGHREILDEYMQNGYVLSAAVDTVRRRHERLKLIEEADRAVTEAVAERIENRAGAKAEAPEVLSPPVVVEEKEYAVVFKVTATKDKLRELKAFLINGGFKYE